MTTFITFKGCPPFCFYCYTYLLLFIKIILRIFSRYITKHKLETNKQKLCAYLPYLISVSFVERWPLMNPNDMVFIIATYLIFILKIGPALMERREPFKMKGFLVFYNIIKVINSTILAYKVRNM